MRAEWKRDREDLCAAELWVRAATALAEDLLEALESCDRTRNSVTRISQIHRAGRTALLAEFREWQSATPELTAALVKAGRHHRNGYIVAWRH